MAVFSPAKRQPEAASKAASKAAVETATRNGKKQKNSEL
jgi:hypothetical protein